MKNEFKVGDVAQAVGLNNWSIYNGDVGRITSVTKDGKWVSWVPFNGWKGGREINNEKGISGITPNKMKKL